VKKVGLKKEGIRKGKYRLRDSGLLGIIEDVTTIHHVEKPRLNFPVPLTYEARNQALAPLIRAEYWKAQAITLVRQNSYQ
jgi:hypothetical protein